MTVPTPAARVTEPQSGRPASRLTGPFRWLLALVQTTRPRQWPKNLLVFAAPLAGHTMGRPYGFWYALTAAIAFVAASSAVYLINDVVDVERDRNSPVQEDPPDRVRPAAGQARGRGRRHPGARGARRRPGDRRAAADRDDRRPT